jgi:hypothetical protein
MMVAVKPKVEATDKSNSPTDSVTTRAKARMIVEACDPNMTPKFATVRKDAGRNAPNNTIKASQRNTSPYR